MISEQKISAALLDYAEPLIDLMGEDGKSEALQKHIDFAVVVWNACVLDQWAGTSEKAEAFRRQVAQLGEAGPKAILEMMIKRKLQHFRADPRLIGRAALVDRNGETVLQAEARIDDRYKTGQPLPAAFGATSKTNAHSVPPTAPGYFPFRPKFPVLVDTGTSLFTAKDSSQLVRNLAKIDQQQVPELVQIIDASGTGFCYVFAHHLVSLDIRHRLWRKQEIIDLYQQRKVSGFPDYPSRALNSRTLAKIVQDVVDLLK